MIILKSCGRAAAFYEGCLSTNYNLLPVGKGQLVDKHLRSLSVRRRELCVSKDPSIVNIKRVDIVLLRKVVVDISFESKYFKIAELYACSNGLIL